MTDLLPKSQRLITGSVCPQELAEYAAWLSIEGYTAAPIHLHLIYLGQALSRLARPDERGLRRLADLERAFDPGGGPPTRKVHFEAVRRAYMRFLRSQGRLIEPAARDRFVDLRHDYEQYLVDVRGLSSSTRAHHAHTVADFLARGAGSRRLSALTQREIEAFIALRSRELSRHSMQHIVAQLRAFLRFCYEHGEINSRLDLGIDTPRTYRGELMPRAAEWRTVQALLASIDRASKSGWRDYCILHLIAHYGLRPSEVVTLRLDSIDWEQGILRVKQHKTLSDLRLPLAGPTMRVLHQYLAMERERQGWTHPEMFLRERCPDGPLLRTAVADIFEKRMRAAKLSTSRSVYCLRHAFAMRLLGRGVGIKLIGDLLGHRHLDTTRTYLRLDIKALRGVALEVPHNRTAPGGRHAQP